MKETGHGLKMHRADWTDDQLAAALNTLVTDQAMQAKLQATSAHMRAQSGTEKAAKLLDQLLKG